MQTGRNRKEAGFKGCNCCSWITTVPRKGKEVPRIWSRREDKAKPKDKDIRRYMKIYSDELCHEIELRRGAPARWASHEHYEDEPNINN